MVLFKFKGDKFSLEAAGDQKSAELQLNSRLDFDEEAEIYNLTINATVSTSTS